jgi:uncharacterized repeat protein (TIGR03943 family)
MPKRLYRSLQALLLLGMSIFLAFKAASGQLVYYINQRFVPLTVVAIIFLAVITQTLFAENKRSRQHDDDDHDHAPASANLWFMLVPLLIGVLIPSRPLDSSSFATKGFSANTPLVSADSSAKLFETASQERNILDWVKLFNFQNDIPQVLGQQAAVTGFVYFDKSLNKNQFFVSRFVISCCAADASAIVMIVEWPQASTLKQDSWVLVKGAVQSITLNERAAPLIQAVSVQAVPEPEQPYLFP